MRPSEWVKQIALPTTDTEDVRAQAQQRETEKSALA